MTDSNVPSIRFSGFTDPWEQRKLGELISEITAGKSVNSTDDPVNATDVAVLKTSCVSNGYFEADECKRVVESEKDLVKCPVVAKSIIVSRMNTPDRVGACGLSETSHDNLFLPDRLWRLSLRSDCDPYCVYVILASEASQARIKGMASGTSGSMHNVPKQSFLDMSLLLPADCAEQQAIGQFFSRLDSLITLHQRKYDKLVVLKKSMLEQMFPQEGESVPRIRFSGFTDPWEQRKLGEYLTLSRIVGHTGVDANKLTVKLWGKGVVAKTDSYGGSRNTQYYVRRAGQFMYGKLDFLHAAFGIVPEELDGYESTLDSPAFDMSGVDGVFLLNSVTQEDFYLGNGLIANGSRKAKRIHEDTFLDMPLAMPSLAEQQAIGRFFSRLDSLITLHQRKLELLQNIKKSLLEQMFV